MLLFRLPDNYLPGTDLISKIMLKDERVKGTLVEELVGREAKQFYQLGRCEFVNNTTCDVLFVSSQPDQPPLLFEIQEGVDSNFIRRAMDYSLSINNEYGSMPKVTVFAINGFNSHAMEYGLAVDETMPYTYVVPSVFWAEKCLLLSPTSIKDFDLEIPLNKMVAIESFLSQQEPSLLTTKNKDDEYMQVLYKVAKEKFEGQVSVEEEKLVVISDLCAKAEAQFKKIANCITSGLVDKAKSYATDGEVFFGLNKRKYEKRERETTPIDDLPDIALYPTEPEPNLKQGDLAYIDAFYKTGARMQWETFYKKGKGLSLFGAFSSHQGLKTAYHNRKKLMNLKKRKTTNEI